MGLLSFLCSIIWYLMGLFSSTPQKPVEELPKAKVAVIGAGIGGCFAAKFLRENGGSNLDIHVYAKSGSKIGGRAAVFQFHDHSYETGGSVIHADNKYLVDAAKKHDLHTKGKDDPDIRIGIYRGGRSSMYHIGINKIVSFVKLWWRYGIDLFRMNFAVSALLKKFRNIYSLQASGHTYNTVEEMLTAMGGEEMANMMKVTDQDYMTNEKHWNQTLIHELVGAATRVNYGQDTDAINAFVTMVSLAGMQDGKLWSVVGGNYKLAEAALRDSTYNSLLMEDVVSVRKTEQDNKVEYTITTSSGKTEDGYDAVIVANPLNVSDIKYENFSSDVYTTVAKTPYQRTIATFVKAKIRPEFFGEGPELKKFPLAILTASGDSYPFEFRAVQVEIPSEIEQEDVKDYLLPLDQQPVRVWKVFSPEPLSAEQCQQMFAEVDVEDVKVYDWLAYPQYHPPDQAPPFVLEEGVFYVNAIEKAASAMEMSAIGAKNAALLAQDYILKTWKSNEN